MSDLLEPTPQWQLKPQLLFCGKLFGCDLYVDTKSLTKRDLTENFINKAIEIADSQTEEDSNNE